MFRLIVSLFIVKQTVRWRPEHSLQVSQENKQNETELCMYSMDQAGKDVFAGLKQSTEIYLILSYTHAYFFFFAYLRNNIKFGRDFRNRLYFTRTECQGQDE